MPLMSHPASPIIFNTFDVLTPGEAIFLINNQELSLDEYP